MVENAAELRLGFGNCPRPKRITQKPFDYDDAHLRGLVRLEQGAKPDGHALVAYAHDLQYAEVVQKDLLDYLLPFCLCAWADDLRGRDDGYGGFVEHFYPALVRIVNGVLSTVDVTAVSKFMQAAIIAEVDDQSGLSYAGMLARPYRWISALTTHGVLFPDIGQLWTTWWSQATPGRAIASVQYLSCLIYGDTENPVFARWTPEGGGGPPNLWEFAGHLYTHRWLPANVAFLRRTLAPGAVMDALAQSVEELAGRAEQPMAQRVLTDARERVVTLRNRCAELPELLEGEQDPGHRIDWRQ